MGTHCSSELHRGHIQVKKTTTMKLLLLTALAAIAVAMAEPEADAWHGYYGYGYHPGFYGYGHQQAWPAAAGPGFSSTCFGCRGKRSADAEAEPGYGFYGYYPYGYYGLHRAYYGLHLGAGVAGHPGAATSYSHRSVQGIGKRSAEEDAAPAEAEVAPVAKVAPVAYGFPFFGYGLPAIYNHPTLQWPGFKAPGVEVTSWGARGKRSADAEPGYYGYPYGYYGYPYYGYRTGNYVHRSPQGLGK